jgi:hypothetical protein
MWLRTLTRISHAPVRNAQTVPEEATVLMRHRSAGTCKRELIRQILRSPLAFDNLAPESFRLARRS